MLSVWFLLAHAVEPFELHVVDPFDESVVSVAMATADGRHWFSLQVDEAATGLSRLWAVRRDVVGGLSPAYEVGAPLTDPEENHLPTMAADSGSWVHVVHRIDAPTRGPTNENVQIRPFGSYLERFDPAPELDDGRFEGSRGHAWVSVSSVPRVTFACWTRHTYLFDDDVAAKMLTVDHRLERYILAAHPDYDEEHCTSDIRADGSVAVAFTDDDEGDHNIAVRFIDPHGVLSPDIVELGSADANFPYLIEGPDGSLRLVAHSVDQGRVEWTRCDADCELDTSWLPLEEVSVGVPVGGRKHGGPVVDAAGHDFVAYLVDEPDEDLRNARIYVTARCADGWADGRLVDDTAQGESIGGSIGVRGYPFVLYDAHRDEIDIAYVRDADLADDVSLLDAVLAKAPAQELFDTLCPGG